MFGGDDHGRTDFEAVPRQLLRSIPFAKREQIASREARLIVGNDQIEERFPRTFGGSVISHPAAFRKPSGFCHGLPFQP